MYTFSNQNLLYPYPGSEHNFDKYDADYITGFGESYDYGSVMHYSGYAFSANGQMTIVTTVSYKLYTITKTRSFYISYQE